MIIQRIILKNFKGVHQLDITFDAEVTRIYGRNRSGKTTIADAVTWCLFGKDSKGNTKFGVKTRDDKGEEIPHLEHSVTLYIYTDSMHELKRELVEQWTKSYGRDEAYLKGNTTVYYVDGEKLSQRDYQTYISNICNEDTFRALTTPSHFPSLRWEEQRRILADMCGSVTNEQVAGDDPRFKDLLKAFQERSLERHLDHLGYQCKQIKSQLDQIPIRMEEANRQLPPNEDYDHAAAELQLKKSQRDAILRGSSSDIAKSLTDRLAFAERRLFNIETGATEKAFQLAHDAEMAVREVEIQNKNARSNIDSLKQKIESIKTIISNIDSTSLEEERDEIRKKWAENSALKFTVSESDTHCPTCGQPLPQEQLVETINKMREDFNTKKANTYKTLKAKADKLKKLFEQQEDLIKGYNLTIQQTEEQIASYKILPVPEKEVTPTKEEILNQDSNYQTIKKQADELRKQIEDSFHETPDTSELDAEIESLEQTMSRKKIKQQVTDRINELTNQRSSLNTQLTSLERDLDIAIEFRDLLGQALENLVNDKFSFVKFRLFRKLVNGSVEPYCEATVGGVPYSDLNTADRINAGIDIINALSEYYQVSVPIVIDNAEAINKIIHTRNQKIELYVSDKELAVQRGEESH